MSFQAFQAVAQGNPILAAFSVFQNILGLFQSNSVQQLLEQLQFYRSSFQTMSERGLFGSQVQRRGVEDRTIWETIGWDAPNEVPPLFATTPRGASFVVKDTDAQPYNSTAWVERSGRGRDFLEDLRFADGSWFGARFAVRAGLPPDVIPRIGSDGVHRHDVPPEELQRAQQSQPRQYLGPRPLAGADNAARRAAFASGGGNVSNLWMLHLNNQAVREGRRVRAWTGASFVTSDPSRELFDSKEFTRFRNSATDPDLVFTRRGSPIRNQLSELFQKLRPPPRTRFERAEFWHTNNQLSKAFSGELFRLGIKGPADFDQLPKLLEAV